MILYSHFIIHFEGKIIFGMEPSNEIHQMDPQYSIMETNGGKKKLFLVRLHIMIIMCLSMFGKWTRKKET